MRHLRHSRTLQCVCGVKYATDFHDPLVVHVSRARKSDCAECRRLFRQQVNAGKDCGYCGNLGMARPGCPKCGRRGRR